MRLKKKEKMILWLWFIGGAFGRISDLRHYKYQSYMSGLQWRLPVGVYLGYRLVLMVYGLFWLGYITSYRGNPPQAWGAYLTNWTYVMLNLYLVSHFLAALAHHLLTRQNSTGRLGSHCCSRPSPDTHSLMFMEAGSSMRNSSSYEDIPGSEIPRPTHVEFEMPFCPPWYICVVWVLFNIVSTAALMVTIVFFLFLFPMFSDYPNIDLENLQVHLLNSVIIVIEHLVSGIPCRLLHVIWPFLYGIIYMSFSIIYWAGDHSRVMYPNILDWNQAGTTVGYVLMIGFVIIPSLHGIYFVLHKAKMAIYQRL